MDAADPFGTKGLCLLGSLWDVLGHDIEVESILHGLAFGD